MRLIQQRFRYVLQHSHGQSSETRKGGVKAHVLYDNEAQVPAFYTVTTASKHDSTLLSSIHYEPNAYYIFDRAYDSFKELYKIHLTDSFLCCQSQDEFKV